jgi:hypothetical protein
MTEQDKRIDNTEIMTIQQFEKYTLLFNDAAHCNLPRYSSDYQGTQRKIKQMNEDLRIFILMMQMQHQGREKIIWAFHANFKYPATNILLTNQGRILYIQFNLDISLCTSENHNFDIPSYAICALKMLIKNIEGQYTEYSSNAPPKLHDKNFDSIYKNINEYLEQIQEELLEKELLEKELLEKELLKKKTN